MQVVKYELSVFVDCDDTLLLWDNPTVAGVGKLPIQFAGKTVFLTPHQYHVDLVKMYKQRGYHVTVWSANGWAHAEQTCRALHLEEFVDSVQCKPTKYMDDNPNAASVLGPRVFEEDITKPVVSNREFIEMPVGSTGGGQDNYGTFYAYSDGRKIYTKAINVITEPKEDMRGVLNGR